MAKKKQYNLSIRVTDREQIWGFAYLLISLFVLPSLLKWANGFLPAPLGSAWLNFIFFSLNFLFIFWIFSGFFKRSLVHIGQHIGIFLLAVLIGCVLYLLCNWALSRLILHFFPGYSNLNDETIASMAHGNFAISFIGTVFLVPVAEEALHRGLIFGSLYPKSHGAAYLFSTIIFAAVHVMGYIGVYTPLHLALAFVQYLPAGLLLAWAYRKSGSIFAPILIHMTINTVGMLSLR